MTQEEEFEFRLRLEQEQGAPASVEPLKPEEGRAERASMSRMLAPALNYDATDARGGMARGAGSIGATLLAPIDALARAVNSGKPINVGGYDIAGQDRRAGMDAGLRELGVNTDSTQFKTNKLIGEVAGTAGAGGLASNLATKVAPGVAASALGLLSAVRTGGMTAGGLTGASGAATRAAGGAINGLLSAGLVNPEDAGKGALIGGLMPGGVQLAGSAGKFLNERARQSFAERLDDFSRNAPKNETVRQSIEAGYKIPPNMVNPSLKNQIIESVSGKQATQQLVSESNEKVTGKLVREALGLADDAPINQAALEKIRKTAGSAYAEVSGLSPQAAKDMEALKVARNEATGWFKAYNRSARPDDLAKAKEARALSDQLEEALEAHATAAKKPELIPALRDARKQIAKTYTVGRAVNDASGTVDARVLGRMYEKGLPLSDGLDTAGRFASAFPTVAKSSQQVGSAGSHNLKAYGSLAAGLSGMATIGPAGIAAAGLPFVAPPLARSIMFREGAQKGLLKQAPEMSKSAGLTNLLNDLELQQLLLRVAPVASAH